MSYLYKFQQKEDLKMFWLIKNPFEFQMRTRIFLFNPIVCR